MISKKKFMIARTDGWGYVCGFDERGMPKWGEKSLALKMTEKQWCNTNISKKLKTTPIYPVYR